LLSLVLGVLVVPGLESQGLSKVGFFVSFWGLWGVPWLESQGLSEVGFGNHFAGDETEN
jgi:hypothetical protein